MAISRVPYSSFNKYTFTTGAGTFNLPNSDVDSLYGPGWPITPVTRPEDSDLPRVVDYPVGINYTLQPRIGYEGLMPISALKAAYGNVSEVAAPVNLLIRELCGFVPILRDKKTQQKAKSGHPYEWMTASPDRKTPFNVWMTRYKKSAKIYAAPAFYKRRDGSQIVGMEYIDGSTFFLIVNDRGELPEPNEIDPGLAEFLTQGNKGRVDIGAILQGMPASDLSRMIGKAAKGKNNDDLNDRLVKFALNDFMKKARDRAARGMDLPVTTPAFTQVIKGVPFSFWDKSQIYFVPEPPAPATDSPYGESYIERSYVWIQVVAVMTAFQLGHYRTGNMPEGWATLPKDMFPTLGKIAAYERVYNDRMSESSQVAHSRVRFGPDGMKWIPTKKPDFPKDLYTQAKNNIMYAIGMPPSEMGEKPGSGLGGKGFAEGAETDVMRQILEAEKESLEDAFNSVLRDDGVDDVAFYLDYPQEQINPAKQAEDLWTKFEHGLVTLNDVLSAQNKEPVGKINDPDNLANMHLIISGSNIFVLEKIRADENGIVSPSGGAKAGGSPRNPEDRAKQPIPGDKASREKVARQIEEAGGKKISAKKIFVMPGMNKNEGTSIGIADYSLASFEAGMRHEQEHIDSVDGDQSIIARIVLDHLREDPKYYDGDIEKTFEDHAGQTENSGGDVKKVDIQSHDGAMIAVFMPEDVAGELRKIADGLGLPADAELEKADSLHVTLAFLPGDHGIGELSSRLIGAIQMVAYQHGTISGKIQGYGVFNGADGKKVLYATLDSYDLPFIRTKICEALDSMGVQYGKDHGFVPHVTLAYFPENWKLPEGFNVPDIAVTIDGISLAVGSDITTITLGAGETRLGKTFEDHAGRPGQVGGSLPKGSAAGEASEGREFMKHCGVCPEDMEYFGAPIIRDEMDPDSVSLAPEGARFTAGATWKAEGLEKIEKRELIGGELYKREEAAFLLDQSLKFGMVPLAFISEVDGEHGAAVWKTAGELPTMDADKYADEWIERAAILDHIMGCQDDFRKYATHPDDARRIILHDNELTFPADPMKKSRSIFTTISAGKKLSPQSVEAINSCLGDFAAWEDIKDLIGSEAFQAAQARAMDLMTNEVMP